MSIPIVQPCGQAAALIVSIITVRVLCNCDLSYTVFIDIRALCLYYAG